MTNELQKIIKTGQRKRKKMAVIKMQKQDNELNNRRAAKMVKTGQQKKMKMVVIKMQKEDSELNNRRTAKNGENGAAKEEEDGCHKNPKG